MQRATSLIWVPEITPVVVGWFTRLETIFFTQPLLSRSLLTRSWLTCVYIIKHIMIIYLTLVKEISIICDVRNYYIVSLFGIGITGREKKILQTFLLIIFLQICCVLWVLGWHAIRIFNFIYSIWQAYVYSKGAFPVWAKNPLRNFKHLLQDEVALFELSESNLWIVILLNLPFVADFLDVGL